MQSHGIHLHTLVKRSATFAMLSIVLFTAAVATGLAGDKAAHASTQTYTITDLGTLGYNTTMGYGINANGQIAGRSTLQQTVPVTQGCPPRRKCFSHVYHAFLWSNGTMTDLGTLGGTFSEARALDTADVVGTSTLSGTSFTPTHAFLDHNGHMTDLGTLGGSCSYAYALNDLGEVVGQACTTSNQHAFLWSNGKMTDLGTLGGLTSSASGINSSHQVVGSSETSTTFSSTMHAFLWSNGKMTDLGTLGGSDSIAYAINNAGQVVGYASPPNSSVHAFLYSGGKMTDLGVFFDSSVAEAINTSGVVVGTADVLNSNGTTANHAFIYNGGKLQDLNTLIPPGSGWVLSEATGINDTGQIVCNAYNTTTGYTHAFLLNPI
jgi:probable HAF family extracellular repeat protein